MTRETYNIIMACKNSHNYADCIEAVKDYMSEACNVKRENYSSDQLSDIMKIAMYDYIDTCDRPSMFLRTMESVYNKNKLSIGEHIARTFAITPVKDNNGNYINRFGEWAHGND